MVDDAPEPTTTWLRPREAASYASVSVSLILREARAGRLAAYKIAASQKCWIFKTADIDAWIERSREPLPEPFVPHSRETER